MFQLNYHQERKPNHSVKTSWPGEVGVCILFLTLTKVQSFWSNSRFYLIHLTPVKAVWSVVACALIICQTTTFCPRAHKSKHQSHTPPYPQE